MDAIFPKDMEPEKNGVIVAKLSYCSIHMRNSNSGIRLEYGAD